MKLVIVESPSKATKIQEYLGPEYIVLASYGHITDLAKGGKHGMGIDIEKNFKPHYILSDDKVVVLDKLMNAAKKCDMIYLCSDPDREGTAISWHLKERLQDMGKPFKRAMFNEIKKSKIIKALEEAGDIDMNVVHAQEARRILDRLVGFTASPFLLNSFGPNLSAGRVQSVVSRMIVDREKEIEDFVPEDYWTIQVSLIKGNDSFVTKYSGQLRDEAKANDMKLRLSKEDYLVSNVVSEPENKYPQPPLVTSTLQRIMSKDFGFSPDKTMKIAQSLYENALCTYIRTDSVRVSDEAVEELRAWLKDNNHPIPNKPNVYKNKDAAQDAHECIRPSDVSVLPSNQFAISDPDERLVYSIIWKYFAASQMNPAVYDTLKVTAHVKDDKLAEVKVAGKALISSGFLDIFEIKDDSKIEIPNLIVGDELKLIKNNPIKMDKKQTQPPPRFSEDKLIKELVNRNIGRPATFADLLSKITNRNYVEKRGSVYYGTELGKKITKVLSEFFTFMNYNYTANLESKLDKIEEGSVNYIDMLKDFYSNYKVELDKAYIANGGVLCEKCKSPMATMINKATKEKFTSCSNYLNCRNNKSIADVSVKN